MSWQPGSFGFVPSAPAVNGGFDAMKMWGQQPTSAPLSFEDMIQSAAAAGDYAGVAQMQGILDSRTHNAGISEAMKGMQQSPSKWATGAQTFGNIAQGLASLGNMYLGYKNMKLQQKAFDFNKGVANTNLNNSIMDYNRRLSDTLANRALNNGQGSSWVSEQLAKYSAKRS